MMGRTASVGAAGGVSNLTLGFPVLHPELATFSGFLTR
jgi:hypothetical protein